MSAKCPQSVRGADTSAPAPPHCHAENGGLRASTPLPLRVIGVDALDLISAVSGAARRWWVGQARRMRGGLRGPRGRGGPTVCACFVARAGCRPVLMRVGGQRSPGSRGQDLLMLEQEAADAAGVVRPGLAGWARCAEIALGYAANRPRGGGAPESRPGQIAGNRVKRVEMAPDQRPGSSTWHRRHHPPRPASQPSGGQARSVKGLRPDPLRGLTDAPPPLSSRPGRGPISDGAGR